MPLVLASTQPGRSTTATSGHRATGDRAQAGQLLDVGDGDGGRLVQFADDGGGLLAGGRRPRAHQPPGGASGEVPVDHRGSALITSRYAAGPAGSAASVRAVAEGPLSGSRRPARAAATSSSAASAAASLPEPSATTAKASSRPSVVTTVPARACTPSRVPVLARTVPGAVPGVAPVEERAVVAGDREAGQDRRGAVEAAVGGAADHGRQHRRRHAVVAGEAAAVGERDAGGVDPGVGEGIGDRLRGALEAGREVAGERHLPGQGLGEHVVRHARGSARRAGRSARSGPSPGSRAGRGLAEDDGGAARAEGVGQRRAGVQAGLPAARDRAGADARAVDGGGGHRGGVAGRGVGRAPAAGGERAGEQRAVDDDAGHRRAGGHGGDDLGGEVGDRRRARVGLGRGGARQRGVAATDEDDLARARRRRRPSSPGCRWGRGWSARRRR